MELSQLKLATSAGVAVSTVARIEKKNIFPKRIVMEKLLDALNVPNQHYFLSVQTGMPNGMKNNEKLDLEFATGRFDEAEKMIQKIDEIADLSNQYVRQEVMTNKAVFAVRTGKINVETYLKNGSGGLHVKKRQL